MTEKEREIFKKKIQNKLAKRIEEKKKRKVKITPPRYDEIYWEGVAWVDTL